MTLQEAHRRIRAAVRRERTILLTWLTGDGEYDVRLSKRAAIELLREMEEAGEVPSVIIHDTRSRCACGRHSTLFIDRGDSEVNGMISAALAKPFAPVNIPDPIRRI